MSPWWVLHGTFFAISYGSLIFAALVRARDPQRALLCMAIYFLAASVYWLINAFFVTPYVVISLWDVFMAAFCAYLAHLMWERWNNRRKRRKGRVAGRVGVRLGRLVIIPEA